MKFSSILTVLLSILAICDELQADEFPKDICIKYDYNNGKVGYSYEMENVCRHGFMLSVQSVFVTKTFVQLFIHNKYWAWNAEARILSEIAYPEYVTESTRNQSGRFMKLGAFAEDGELKRVSASFLHFSDCVNEFGYLISGLNAHEFVIRNDFYWPSGKVRPITDFFKEGEQELLMPEDKFEEVVSVALIKSVEKDNIKDHAIYKIILKTVTKKLVKAYFKVTNKGDVISLNGEPFVPSTEAMQENDQFNLFEETPLYYVGEKDKLSMGYQFTKTLGFPIYYDYNPETMTYKEYPMRTSEGFNAELETLTDKLSFWNRYIVPTDTWLGCPETIFCLGRSFDAVFFNIFRYYAIFENSIYYLKTTTENPSPGYSLSSYFNQRCNVDAAFSLGRMVFFIKEDNVYYTTRLLGLEMLHYKLTEVFPGIDETSKFSVSAVITLDKGQEGGVVTEKQSEPSHMKFGKPIKYHKIHVRAGQTTEEDIPKQMVYVYLSTKDGGNVYKYRMETTDPPKFMLVDKKPFKEVNAALPKSVSLVFTANDRVITMVNHFMIEQSSQTFFTQTESEVKFTLVDRYFGCQTLAILEEELSKEFAQEYIKFAAPKPGADVEPDLTDVRNKAKQQKATEHAESTLDDHCPKIVETSSTEGSERNQSNISTVSAQPSSANFIIQAVLVKMLAQFYLY